MGFLSCRYLMEVNTALAGRGLIELLANYLLGTAALPSASLCTALLKTFSNSKLYPISLLLKSNRNEIHSFWGGPLGGVCSRRHSGVYNI